MLTAFFDRNKTDRGVRQYLYKDFPKHYTWNWSSRRWNPRQQGSMKGRLVSANPAEGERFYLRLLLSHITGLLALKIYTPVMAYYTLHFVKHLLKEG